MRNDLYAEMAFLEESHWWFVGRRAIIQQVLKCFLPHRVPKALDIGCGTGKNFELINKFAVHVSGTDASPLALEVARRKYPRIHFSLGDSVPQDKHQTYDLITLFDVLEHIEDDADALRRLYAFLKPRGIAVITVPALPFLWSRHDEFFGHYRRYTRVTLQNVVSHQTHFRIEKMTYFNFFLFPAVFGVRLVRKLLGIKRGRSDFFPLPQQLNALLSGVLRFEAVLLGSFNFPIGVSMICVLRKP